jgi:hypothetical protein
MDHDEHLWWPALSGDTWAPTKQTLHRYLQIVGKIRMSLVPPHPLWWHTTLYPTSRGLTTGPMPYADREVEISFDLLDHRLVVSSSDGRERVLDLGVRPACADFYRDLFSALDGLGLQVTVHPFPYDLGEGPSFPEDTVHASYDADAVTAYWRALAATRSVLTGFASRFTGEASPVQLHWHLMDLCYTRHSVRRGARRSPADHATTDEDLQVIAFGFDLGSDQGESPAFHSYTAPEPQGLVGHPLVPVQARWRSTGSGHRAVLPYDVVRATPDPEQTLLDFYESAYLAGADSAGWDVAARASGRVPGLHGPAS